MAVGSISQRLLALTASLRGRLLLLWLFIVLLSTFMAVILVGLYQSGSAVQIEAGRRTLRSACEAIQTLYAANFTQQSAATEIHKDLLTVLVSEALSERAGVEGGIWDKERGFLAYAFPTHEGAAPKVDIPAAEVPWIVGQNEKSLSMGGAVEEIRRGTREALMLATCPLDGTPLRVAWAMIRVRTATSDSYDRLTWGLALLLGFAAVSGGWLALALSRWSRGIAKLEKSLKDHPVDRLPLLEPSGNEDIDRIIDALNAFTQRLAVARDEAAILGAKLTNAERLAALGRVTAGIAHEIRNPISAMRLKAENALAHSPERQRKALQVIVGQIDRLNELCDSLLSLARPFRLEIQDVPVRRWIEERMQAFSERAKVAGISLTSCTELSEARFDPAQIGRVLDNLIINALQHTPHGGRVNVSVAHIDHVLRMTVSDTGSGVSEVVRGNLFEPFVSDRAGGTGLGLAIAREIVEAHDGSIVLVPSASGAMFQVDIPWRAS